MTLTEIIFWLDLAGLFFAALVGVTWVAIKDRKELDQ